MSQPLALVLYENLLPGSKLVNRLQDLGYRVVALHDPSLLQTCAQREKPLVIFAELESAQGDVCSAIAKLRCDVTTQHLPLIAFGEDKGPCMHDTAHKAGATMTVSNSRLLDQLEALLDQALNID